MTDFFGFIPWDEVGIQFVGFVAMALDCLSFQAKKRMRILQIQTAACVLWVLQMVLLGGYTGAAMNLLAIGRAVLFMQKDKHAWARSKWVLYLTIAAFVAAAALTFESALSLLPMGAMIVSTIALYISDEKKIRILSLFAVPQWFFYDFTMGSVAGVAAEILNFTSIIVALIRYRTKKNKHV